jgi:aryl-alcohol dehydrogenase-like predicted oxidoreductase
MEFKNLGRTGVKIPVLGQGTWGMGGFSIKNTKNEDEEIRALRLGFDLEMRFIDTAEMYAQGHSEEVVAKAIGDRRDSIFLATKVSPEHLSYDDVLKACNASLKRLRTTYIDLYQVHWPNTRIPISQTMKAMESLCREGKIRYVGVSNFSAKQSTEAQESLSIAEVVANQVEYNLLSRSVEPDLLRYAEERHITIIAYSPLARGLISTDGGKEDRWKVIDNIATKYGRTRNQVALNWLIAKRPVVAIPKTSNLEHLRENVGAQGWKMLKEDEQALSKTFA